MPIVRTTAVATTVLTATVSAAVLAAHPTTYSASVQVSPTPVIAMSVLVVPQNILENQTVSLSDFRQLSVDKVLIDIATATDDVAISFDTSFTDSVTMEDTVNRMFYGNIDFDPTDPDADPDPITMADAINSFTTGKALTDTATPSDTVAKTPGKVLTDATSGATDTINQKDIGKSLIDSAAATDAVTTFDAAKVVADSASITDAAAKELTRPDVADSIAATDDSFRAPGLGKTDSVTAADSVNSFTLDKPLTDTASATDAAAKDFTRPDVVDSASATDDTAKEPGKVATDSVNGTDVATTDIGKTLTDATTGATDVAVFDQNKSPSDSAMATDAINTFDATKALTDSVTITEFIAKTPGYEFDYDIVDADADPDPVTATDVMAKDFTRPNITDTASATDAISNQPELPKTETVTATDSDAKSFDTARTESVSATDAAAIDTTKVLTDATTGATDAIVTSPIKVVADAVTGTDAINVFDISTVLADTASVTDSLITTLILGQTSPLYDFAFVSDDKFTYFPVPGALNEHLIHQPLVNGEFVLTTDPNAGIVYTIRTESYSYMFAGYGLNENQLN